MGNSWTKWRITVHGLFMDNSFTFIGIWWTIHLFYQWIIHEFTMNNSWFAHCSESRDISTKTANPNGLKNHWKIYSYWSIVKLRRMTMDQYSSVYKIWFIFINAGADLGNDGWGGRVCISKGEALDRGTKCRVGVGMGWGCPPSLCWRK